jgi:hypothetical protein
MQGQQNPALIMGHKCDSENVNVFHEMSQMKIYHPYKNNSFS